MIISIFDIYFYFFIFFCGQKGPHSLYGFGSYQNHDKQQQQNRIFLY